MSGCGLLSVATGSAGKRALRRVQHLAKPYPIPYQGKNELVPFNKPNGLILCSQKTEIRDFEFSNFEPDEKYFDEKFDEILNAFSTTEAVEASFRSGKRKGISDNEYYLIKLNAKLKKELPNMLFPNYEFHDYSIYSENVKTIINVNSKFDQTRVGISSLRLGIRAAKTAVKTELRNPEFQIQYSKVLKKRGALKIKWCVTGHGRMPPYRKKTYTFISDLQLGEKNLIEKHEVTNMEINQQTMVKAQMGVLAVLAGGLGGVAGGYEDGYSEAWIGYCKN